MKKHVIDQPRTNAETRLAQFTRLEARDRVNGPHPAVEALRRQVHPVNNAAMTEKFVRLDRSSDG